MTLKSYDRTLDMTKQLALSEQLRLLEDLTRIVRRQVDKKTYSIMDLEGLGADIWQGIDAQKYINEERASWDS